MRIYIFTLLVWLIGAFQLNAQNLYTQANAANIENELNTTTGWTGPAAITSSATNPQNGSWSLLITSNPNGNRHGSYSFTAVVGTVYNISIWARRGSNNSNSVFANWINLQNFVTTSISSQTWTEYNFTVTATSTSPVIRVYASEGGPAGRSVYVDAITITAQTGGGGDTQPPTAPTNLASSNVTETSLTLNWTASTDNVAVTNYRIYQNNTEVGQTGNATTTFNVTGLTASTAYSYYVRAEDAAGNLSANSNTIDVTTATGGGGADTEPPTTPINLASSNVTSTALTLTWTGSTDNVAVTNYRIYQNNTEVGQTGNATTTFNVTGLTASTAYSYYVRAEDAAGNLSANSNTINVTTPAGADTQAPTAPTNLASSNVTSTALTLTWTGSTDNVAVTNYRIYQNNTEVGQTGNATTTFNVTGLTASTAYSYYVRAEDAAGNLSANSNTINVTTSAGADTQAPTAPTNLAATNVTTSTLTLSWTASTDNVAVTNYRIYQNNTQIGQTGNASTTFNVTGLTAATTYNYFVRALDAAGNISGNSNTANITTAPDGGGGGGSNAYTTANANLPTVNWQAQNLYVAGVMGISSQPNSAFLLSVNGDIRTKDLIVQPGWSDFVFEPDYQLPSLKEVEEFIIANGRLIDIPSAAEIQENGARLGETNALLLLKIEELTLYLIEMNHRLDNLHRKVEISY